MVAGVLLDSFDFYTPGEIQRTLGAKIRDVRKAYGWTQKEMAKKASIPLSTYARFEQLGEGSMRDFAKILVVFRRGAEIEILLNVASKEESPIDAYRNLSKKKRRRE